MSETTANMDRGWNHLRLWPLSASSSSSASDSASSASPPVPAPSRSSAASDDFDALVARFFSGQLWNSKKGESHDHRPSPRFDFAISFDLRRKISSTALRFFSGFGLTRRDP